MTKKRLIFPLIAIIMATITLTSCITNVTIEDIAGKTFIKTNRDVVGNDVYRDYYAKTYKFNEDGTYEYLYFDHNNRTGDERGWKIEGTYELGMNLKFTEVKAYSYSLTFGKKPVFTENAEYLSASKPWPFKVKYDENGELVIISTLTKEVYTLLHE